MGGQVQFKEGFFEASTQVLQEVPLSQLLQPDIHSFIININIIIDIILLILFFIYFYLDKRYLNPYKNM